MIDHIKRLKGHKMHSVVLFDNGYGFALFEAKGNSRFAVARILISGEICEYYWWYKTNLQEQAIANYKQRTIEYLQEGHLITDFR